MLFDFFCLIIFFRTVLSSFRKSVFYQIGGITIGKQTFEAYESEVRSYCRKFPEIMDYAKGSIIKDVHGNSYIDFFCGAGALNYGHNNDFIKTKVIDYLESDRIIHALDMYTVAKENFIDYFEINALKPRGLDYKIQFTGPTGTNAIEAAIKLARKVKKRENIFAFMGAFHGMSLGALAMTSDRYSRGGGGTCLNNVTHIPAPYMFPELDVLNYIETLISDDHSGVEIPAAIVLETVQAEGGIHVFEKDFIIGLRKICDKYDILMIVDDIQVGCARTGTFFSFERAGVIPDIVTLSKSIGGYGFPFAITLLKPELDIWKPGEHNGTFRGNQLAMVAAKAGLEFMINEKVEKQVVEKEKVVKEFLMSQISKIDERLKVRGIGLIWGVDFEELKDEALPGRVVSECFKNGLIVERAGRKDSVVKIMPSLVIDLPTLNNGLEILKNSINFVLKDGIMV